MCGTSPISSSHNKSITISCPVHLYSCWRFCGNIYRMFTWLHIFYLSRNQTHFYLWQVTLTLVSDDDPLVFHGQGWGRRKLDAEQFAAESVLMKLPEVDKMLVIFGWVNISRFPWKFKGGTFFCLKYEYSIHEESCFTMLQLTSQKP